MAFPHQFRTQLGIVLDDAVVDDGQHASTIGMGMSVDVVGATMRSPARVTNAQASLHEDANHFNRRRRDWRFCQRGGAIQVYQ